MQNGMSGNWAEPLSPSSNSTRSSSSSSDESLEFMPACHSFKKSVIKSNRAEFEAISVMTRSASRKYATVGALYNKVNVEQELKKIKYWPENITYPIPTPENQNALLKNTVSEAFFQVAAFCKLARDSQMFLNPNETVMTLDLSQNSTEGRSEKIIDGISLQVEGKVMPCQIINLIPLSEEDLDIPTDAERNGKYQLIALYAEPNSFEITEQKFYTETSTSYLSYDRPLFVKGCPNNNIALPLHNDHSYASKYDEENKLNKCGLTNEPPSEFKLNEALNNLLLNTALLKCLVCGELPQDIASYLKRF